MVTALNLLALTLMDLMSLQRKLLSVGLVEYSPLFYVLVRFYGMLQLRAKGHELEWDWQAWLEDITDDELRLRLRVCLENDEALQSGGLPDELETRRHHHRRRKAHLAS